MAKKYRQTLPKQMQLNFDHSYEFPWRIYEAPYSCAACFRTEKEAKDFAQKYNIKLS